MGWNCHALRLAGSCVKNDTFRTEVRVCRYPLGAAVPSLAQDVCGARNGQNSTRTDPIQLRGEPGTTVYVPLTDSK